MAIAFTLDTLCIRGFRGIAELELELPRDAPLVLIGNNNCGKSTVLDAMAFALQGPKFYNYDVSEFDFFRDANGSVKRFEIDVHFKADKPELLPAVRGIENPIPVHGCRASGRRVKDGIEAKTELFGVDGKAASFSPRTPLRGELKEAYAAHDIGYTKVTARWRDIPECRPDVWSLAPDNLYHSLYTWKTGPLQRLSKWLAGQFMVTQWEFEYGGKTSAMPDGIKRAHQFFTEAVANFPVWKDQLRPMLVSTLSSYVGRQAEVELRPQIQAVQEWLAQQLALAFSTDAGQAATPLDCMGHGWQSLVRMAALDVLSQLPDQFAERVVILVEEPETYLHPHLARRFRRVVTDLAARGWCVVISTHSPSLFRLDGNQTVVRLRRDNGVVTKAVAKSDEASALFKIQAKLDERGTHEFLFSQKAVFCEGRDDVYAVRMYLEKLGADLDTLGVSVVDVGSVQNLHGYAGLASKLLIPWMAISDQDIKDGVENPKTAKVRTKLDQIRSQRDGQTMWPARLEDCLGSNDATPEWQAENVEPLPVEAIRATWPRYAGVLDEVAKFLNVPI